MSSRPPTPPTGRSAQAGGGAAGANPVTPTPPADASTASASNASTAALTAAIGASPNPFLSPDTSAALGIQPASSSQPSSLLPGLSPVASAAPSATGSHPALNSQPSPPERTSPDGGGNQSTTEQTLLGGGGNTVPSPSSAHVGSPPPSATVSANSSSAPAVAHNTQAKPTVRADASTTVSAPSTQNVHIPFLSAEHIFEAVFIDLPALSWLRQHWIAADLNGRNILRLPATNLADVLVDLETAAAQRITSRFQRLSIARAIYTLLASDTTTPSETIASWDCYSLGMPPPPPISVQSSSITAPVAHGGTSMRPAIPGTYSHPVAVASPLHPPTFLGTAGRPIVIGTSPITPSHASPTIITSVDSSATPAPLRTTTGPEPHRLFTTDNPAQTAPSTQTTERTRSIAAEFSDFSELNVHGPVFSEANTELALILADGTRVYKPRPMAPQVLHYPTLFSFDRDAWEHFIVKYRREHLVAHVDNQIPIVRRLDHGIIQEVCDAFHIKPESYHAVTNAFMERMMFTRFGPVTPSAARDRFLVKHFKFDDITQSQSTFASKLARFMQEKRELLQDFKHAELATWKPTEEFTHSMVIDALIKCFPIDPNSSNNELIVQMIRDHRGKTLQEIKSILYEHFRAIDLNVEAGQGSYHVYPTKTKLKKRLRDERGTPRDGGGSAPNRNQRNNPNIHERGICGSRKHTCSASTCLLWGEPEAKPADYSWGADEPSIYVEPARYEALKTAKPQVLASFNKNPLESSSASQSGASRGRGIPHGGKGRGSELRRGGRGRGSSLHRGSSPRKPYASNVNASRYAFDSMRADDTPNITATTEPQHPSFYAVARIARQLRTKSGRCTRTLMDTGADSMNIIRSSIVDDFTDTRAAIDVISRRINCTTLVNNGKEIGRSAEEVRLSFTLDTLPGVEPTTYTEWFFMFDDLQDEMVLGRTFNRTHGFSTYHESLLEWRNAQFPTQEPRHRDRVVNRHERQAIIADELRHATVDVTSCTKYPGTGVPIIRRPQCHGVQHYPLPANVQGKLPSRELAAPLPAPVDYDRTQSKELARHLAHVFTAQRTTINKAINSYTNDAARGASTRLSEQDLEALLDQSKHAARDAEEFYYSNAHLLDKRFDKPGYTKPTDKRYFMDDWKPPLKPETPDAPKFTYGLTAVLQGLHNFAMLNDCPVRILNYDADTNKYTIHVASERAPAELRGYWLSSEQFLRSADPLKQSRTGPASAATADLEDMGIDHESGNPTLDPEHRPVHRQFGKAISTELTEKIRLLKEKYKEIFSTDIRQPCKFRPMGIQLVPNAVLPRSPRFWKNSPEMRNEVRKQLQKLLADNVVIPSTTTIVSNVLLVKRPGMPGKFRFTVDLRQVNQATVPVKWCMPDVQNQLDRLKGCKIFGALDISQYYHQIELEKGSQYLTGFITEDGVYQYQRVPMGLTSACAWAQQELQKAIDADPILVKHNVRNYFDDIPIGAATEEGFLEVLEALLALCARFNLKINADKSVFGVDSITHVGFIVDSNGSRVDPMRTQSFRDMAVPTSVKGVQAVLGAMNYVRHFIPNFSVRAKPLTDLVSGRKQGQRAPKFIWTEAAQRAFDDLKEAVTNTPPLAFLDYAKEIFIRCDSSQFGAGAVLFQFDSEGREHPVAYASRKYTLAERNYNTFQQEASVIVWSLEKFAEFFQGHPVTVQSDHRNLAWIKRSAMPQLTRWRIRLQDFDFKIEYLPGPQQVVADGLSRLGSDDKDLQITMGDFLPTNAAAISLLNSPLPLRALNNYGQHIPGRAPTEAELIWNDVHDIPHVTATAEPAADSSPANSDLSDSSDDNNHAMLPSAHTFNALASRRNKRPAAPPVPSAPEMPAIPDLNEQDVERLLHRAHSDIVGHAGVFTTLQRALTSNKGGWANRKRMLADVDAFISGCPTCQKFRKRRTHADHRFVIEGSPFAELSVDILKLPRADCHNCKYVVVIVDSFTRWTNCVAVEDKTALSAARALLQTVGIFGVPLTIRSDGGGEFINDVLKSLEHILGTSHHKVSPYLHTGNSLAEKANRSVLENLRNLIFDKRLTLHGEHQWSDLLPLAQRIINSSFNSSIGCSPASLLFGENVDLDRCLLRSPPTAISTDPNDYISQLSNNQRILLDAASQHLDAVHAANLTKWKATNRSSLKLQAAVQKTPLSNAVQEGAWVLARVLADAPHDKLKPRWAGPFRLLDFKSSSQSTVRLWDTITHRVLEAHINDVELWDNRFEHSVEGLTKIAETDQWSYPISAILAIALKPADDDDEPVALPSSHKRTKGKHAYLVSVQWQGYAEPSWVPLPSVLDTSIFQLWHQQRPLLRL